MRDWHVKSLFGLGISMLVVGLILTPSNQAWADLGFDTTVIAVCRDSCSACGNAIFNPNGPSPVYICAGLPGFPPVCSTGAMTCGGCTGWCEVYLIPAPIGADARCGCSVN